MIFFQMPRREHKRVLDGGAVYYVMNGDPETGDSEEPLIGRLVCDWSMTEAGVSQFLDLLRV
jgi:threonine aldolase